LPQAPQFLAFVVRSTQAFMHCVCPAAQPIEHAPPTHVVPPRHTFAHAPQLRGSTCVSVHWPAHCTSLPLHAQEPLTHVAPVPHVVPHAPQSKGSDVKSTHAPPHVASPIAQLDVHVPSEQTWPLVHFMPHAPQLFGSPCASVHTPLQRMPPL
jgi:hypothetical protein